MAVTTTTDTQSFTVVWVLFVCLERFHVEKFDLRLQLQNIFFQCDKRGLDDYVQIGGSSGLDNTHLDLADAVCGLNSVPSK